MRSYEFIREDAKAFPVPSAPAMEPNEIPPPEPPSRSTAPTRPTIPGPTQHIDPDEPWDSSDKSIEEIEARIAQLDRQLKHITPVDQEVDAGNGDKIMKNISPRDLERINQGLPPNKDIERMPWTGRDGSKLKPIELGQPMPRGYQT